MAVFFSRPFPLVSLSVSLLSCTLSAWPLGCHSPLTPPAVPPAAPAAGVRHTSPPSPFSSSCSTCNSRIVLGPGCPLLFIAEAVCQPALRPPQTCTTVGHFISSSVTPFAIVRFGCNTSFKTAGAKAVQGDSRAHNRSNAGRDNWNIAGQE